MCNKKQAEYLAAKRKAEIQVEAERQLALSDILEVAEDEYISIEELESLGITVRSCNGSFASVDIGGIRGILIR